MTGQGSGEAARGEDTFRVVAPGELIVACARAYLGVPFRHLGRNRRGLDCVGLVMAAYEDAGAIDAAALQTGKDQRYGPVPNEAALLSTLETMGVGRVPWKGRRAGDVLLLLVGGERSHVGILTTDRGYETMIHAYSYPPSTVNEVRLQGAWARRTSGVYRMGGG